MLLIMPSSSMPLLPIFSRCSRTVRGTPGCSRAMRSSPRITFSGVRISWLTLARKAVLARLLSSAAFSSTSIRSPSRIRRVIRFRSRYIASTKRLPPKRMPATMRSGFPKIPTAR